MQSITAGEVSKDGVDGVDYWLKHYNMLPNRYIKKSEARTHKWDARKGNLADVLPGKVIGGDIYYNDDEHLPMVSGRVWHEADIEYSGGFRSGSRIVYSNDGLLFVSYDHYQTFVEVV